MMTPLERLNSLPRDQHTAFLALFAGARQRQLISRSGDTCEERFGDFGKAECGWVENRRDFYQRVLPELGLIVFTEEEPRPALGMVAGSTCWYAEISITDDGWEAREAWWAEWREGVAARAAEFDAADAQEERG